MSHKVLISVIIPVYNESSNRAHLVRLAQELSDQYQGLVEMIISDSGSSDDLIESLKGIDQIRISKSIEKNPVPAARSFINGARLARGTWLVLMPCDLVPDPKCFEEILKVSQSSVDYGFFRKKYLDQNLLLTLQGLILNWIRAGRQRQFVWTNMPFFRRDLLPCFSTNGFLDDLMLSDRLRTGHFKCHQSRQFVFVSSRRYTRSGVVRQQFRNALVLILYRTLKIDPLQLAKIYQGKASIGDILRMLELVFKSRISLREVVKKFTWGPDKHFKRAISETAEVRLVRSSTSE